MPTLRRFLITTFMILWAFPAVAATTDINFIGPKVTNTIQWTPPGGAPTDLPIMLPQDFSVYSFLGPDSLLDAVVPAFLWHVLGLENLNTWEKLGPNEFWNPNIFGEDDYGALFFQALNGDFDNNGTEDIVLIPHLIANFDKAWFHVCFNFTGTSCSDLKSYNLYTNPGEADHDHKELIPMYGDVGDINGDGIDDLALVTWARYDSFKTHYVGLTSNDIMNIAAENYQPVLMERFYGITLALGDYDNDNKLDAAIAGFNHDANKGVLHTLIANEGMVYDVAKGNIYEDCQFPTGLESYDPDASNFDDLVLTCMMQRDGNTIKGGPVKILTNQGGAGHSFNVAQNLVTPGEKGLNYPTRTAIGDFNEDNQPDLVVAEPGSRKVLVYEGVGPFAVDADTRRELESAPYPSTYIQVHDFNGDGKQDIITTASMFTSLFISSLEKQSNVANTTAAVRPWSRLCVTKDFAQRAEGKNAYLTETDGLQAFAGAVNTITPLQDNQGTASAYTQRINRADYDYAMVNAQIVVSPPTNQAVDSIAVTPNDIKQCDGVLVWLNFSPTVNLGQVDCNTQEIDFSCTASPGTTIKKCEATSTDFTVELSQTPDAGNNWTGKIKAPTGITQYKITVTATSETGGGGESMQTGILDVNLGDCGGPAGCPEAEKVVTVWPTEPFSLCAPDSLVQKAVTLGGTVEWEQTGGAPLLVPAEDKNFAYKNIQFNGNCLSGSFALDASSAFIKEDFSFIYRVNLGKGQTLECPAKLTKLQAQVEGSGTCALNPAAKFSAWHLLSWVFLTLPLFFYGVRRIKA